MIVLEAAASDECKAVRLFTRFNAFPLSLPSPLLVWPGVVSINECIVDFVAEHGRLVSLPSLLTFQLDRDAEAFDLQVRARACVRVCVCVCVCVCVRTLFTSMKS